MSLINLGGKAFIEFIDKHLLSTYYIPSTVLGTKNPKMKKIQSRSSKNLHQYYEHQTPLKI